MQIRGHCEYDTDPYFVFSEALVEPKHARSMLAKAIKA